MGKNSKSPEDLDIVGLVKEIVQDAENLIGQQIELLGSEVRQEVQQAKAAALSVGAGAGLLALGGVISSLMVVHGVQRATGLPLWASYGLVGGLLGTAGLGMLAAGRRKAEGVELLPRTSEALKENLSWIKEQATM